MPAGPGKYDDECTLVRERLKARGVVLLVAGGKHGDGFSAQVVGQDLLSLPSVLRTMADAIERDVARMGH
jgi:hypothetical protein